MLKNGPEISGQWNQANDWQWFKPALRSTVNQVRTSIFVELNHPFDQGQFVSALSSTAIQIGFSIHGNLYQLYDQRQLESDVWLTKLRFGPSIDGNSYIPSFNDGNLCSLIHGNTNRPFNWLWFELKKTIRTTSIPQIKKIHTAKMAKFWPQMAKFWPSQKYPGKYTMICSKKTTRVVSIPKIMKMYSGVWKW